MSCIEVLRSERRDGLKTSFRISEMPGEIRIVDLAKINRQ